MYKNICSLCIVPCLLIACGSSGGDELAVPSDDGGPTTVRADVRDTDSLYVYRENSPYNQVLKECALASTKEASCTLNTLPFITQATPEFSRDDIMDRLLVTHDWMGQRFEALLADAPESMIPLFGSITAISIGSTIRPSNYWSLNGSIRLDPAGMWLSNSEKANVSIKEDFRAGFGAELQFWSLGALRKGDSQAFDYYNLTDTRERTFDEIKISNYSLWYHELAHAVDFLPSESVSSLVNSLKTSDALFENENFFLSPQLVAQYPLLSNVLWALGKVSFDGQDATEEQKSFTPTYVGSEMANDGAMQYYSYNTIREDFATLFEKVMIKREFDVDYYVAYVQKPTNVERYSCSELIVGWGVKNRLADPLVQSRARWVVESIYGAEPQLDQFFLNNVGQQVSMTPGVDWCTNRDDVRQLASELQSRSRPLFDPEEFERLEAQRLFRRH
jgi:hypothetical protein